MRIGVICLRYGHGGAGHHVQSLANELVAKGHKVDIFCGRNLSSLNDMSELLRVHDLGISFQYGSPSWWSHRLRRILRRNFRRPLKDLDVLNGNPVSGDLAAVAKKMEIPYASTLHGSLKSMLRIEKATGMKETTWLGPIDFLYKFADSRIERLDYLRSDAVIAVSETVENEYTAEYGGRNHSYVIPPCADPGFFKPRSQENGKHPLSVSEAAEPYILFVGSSLPRKGFHYLLQAFRRLSVQDNPPRLVVAAGGSEAITQSLTAKERSDDRIIVLDWLPTRQLATLMNSASVLAFPSIYEGLPLTIIEAMSQGLPVVGFRTTGVHDIIQDGRTGYQVPLADIEAFADALAQILRRESLRDNMSKSAQKLSHSLYHPSKIVESYVGVYEALC